MDNFWLAFAALAGYLLGIISAILRIRQRTVQRIDYLRLAQIACFGALLIDYVDLWYLQHADIDTFITY